MILKECLTFGKNVKPPKPMSKRISRTSQVGPSFTVLHREEADLANSRHRDIRTRPTRQWKIEDVIHVAERQ